MILGAALALVVAALLIFLYPKQEKLILYNADTGEVYATWQTHEGMRFSITFIHSVHQSPLCDVYEIRNGNIYVVETRYSAFGAGVQTELLPGQSLTYQDGQMIVSGFDLELKSLRYIIGTVSDHTLNIEDKTISLRELCGKNAPVVFTCKKQF